MEVSTVANFQQFVVFAKLLCWWDLSLLQTSFVDNIAPATQWYNGDALDASDQGYSSYYNKQCGGFTLVQHRVREYSSMHYTPAFHELYPVVWPDLGTAASTSKAVQGLQSGADRSHFGPLHDPHKYAWSPDSAGEFQGGGFMVYFPSDEKLVQYMLQEMKADRFIDKQTRKLEFIVTSTKKFPLLICCVQHQVHLLKRLFVQSSVQRKS
jgi:hypothetical protein